MKKQFCIFAILICLMHLVSAQSTFAYKGDRNYSLIERTDLRRYDNGKYRGLVSREVRSFITRSKSKQVNKLDYLYDGNFYVTEQTVSSAKETALGIHDSIPSVFEISEDGKLKMIVDNGYPSFRSFPSFPQENILPGNSWRSSAIRAVDPLNKGIITHIPMEVAYTFIGEEVYKGIQVFRINAKWATRYDLRNCDKFGDKSLVKANGSHSANMLVSKETGVAILIHDYVDELFTYDDGLSVQLKGTISLFTEYPPSIDHENLIPALQRIAKVIPQEQKSFSEEKISNSDISEKNNFTNNKNQGSQGYSEVLTDVKSDDTMLVEQTDSGLRLSVRDIRFKPDSSEILPEEISRINKIAEVLRLTPNSHFLIEGHSASVGNPSGEQKVSEERARAIALLLSKVGISSDRFICRGFGSSKPIASNETSEGKALNRRVEITILE